MLKYLKKDNIIIEIDVLLDLLTFYDSLKKSYYCQGFESGKELQRELKKLEKEYDKFVVSDELRKELDGYEVVREYQIQVYKKTDYYYIVVVEERLSLLDLDLNLKDNKQEYIKYSSSEELQEAIKKIPEDYSLHTKDMLGKEELDALYYLIDEKQEEKTEKNSQSYQPQFSKQFPFFGAGNATYFEYIGLFIRFIDAPTKKQQKKLLKKLPDDYNATLDDFNNKVLSLYMEYGYDGMAAIYYDGFEELNSKIELGLLEIHKICPIQFAYRSEDAETNGTEFSEWHEYSGNVLLKPLIDSLEKEIKDLDRDDILELKDYLNEISSLYGVDTTRFEKDLWNPKESIGTNEENSIDAKINKLKRVDSWRDADDIISKILEREQEDIGSVLYEIFKANSNRHIFYTLARWEYGVHIINYAQKNKKLETLEFYKKNIVEIFNSTYKIDTPEELSLYAKTVMALLPPFNTEKVPETDILEWADNPTLIGLVPPYDKILKVDVFLNLLRQVSTFLPKLDASVCHIFLERALPHGGEEPMLFWAAAEIYSGIGEMQNAYMALEKAIEYRINKTSLKVILKDLTKKDGPYKNLIQDDNFDIFLKEYKEKCRDLL